MFLFQAVLNEDNSKTESPRVKKHTKSAEESSKKRKHSAEVPTEKAPVPSPPVVPDILSIVAPDLMLAPKGKQKMSPSTPVLQLQGITVTKLPLEEPDHQTETLQVKL